jgi:AraC-like DNA-binding protein
MNRSKGLYLQSKKETTEGAVELHGGAWGCYNNKKALFKRESRRLKPLQLFVDSLHVRFLHIQHYELDYRWRIPERDILHNVLWYVEKGSFLLNVNGVDYPCKEGESCLLPAHARITCHGISSEIELTSINFDAEISFLSNRSWAEILNAPVVYSEGINGIRPVVAEMKEMASSASPFKALLLEAGMLRILYLLLSAGSSGNDEAHVQALDSRIHAIIDYLLCRPSLMPEISTLAELVELSESHLRKLFLQHTGQAPLHFIHQLKIEQAKKMLVSTNKPVSQIALDIGIRNANYFTRLFTARVGMAPQQYRQHNRLWLN